MFEGIDWPITQQWFFQSPKETQRHKGSKDAKVYLRNYLHKPLSAPLPSFAPLRFLG